MDWKEVGQAVAKFAPTLGATLGGPMGAAVGGIVAAVFGVDAEPSQVKAAIERDPEVAVKLAKVEAEVQKHEAALAVQLQQAKIAAETAATVEQTKRAAEVNKTIRAELQAGVAGAGMWRTGWRPYIGWIFGTCIGWLLICIGVLLLTDPAEVQSAVEGIAALNTVFITMLAVLGVTVRARSDDKATALGAPKLTLLAAAAKRLAGG